MKRKRKPSKRKPRLGERLIKALEEIRDELKRKHPIVVAPQTIPIIIKLPNIGEDEGPGNPVPWRSTPGPGLPNPAWQPTCFPVSYSTTSASNGSITHWHVKP